MQPAPEPGAAGGAPAAPATVAAGHDRAILAAALDPIISIDSYGVIQSASDSVERVFGWTPQELIGRNVKVLMPEPHHSAHDGYLANYRRTGHTTILGKARQFLAVRKSGVKFPVEISVARAEAPEGGLPLFVGIIRDISEQKRLERELRLIQSVALSISSAPDLDTGLIEAIRQIVTATGWDYGEAWTVTPGGDALVPTVSWTRPGSGLDAFAKTMPPMRFRRGEGLPGRAWETARPVWVGDVGELRDSEFCRSVEAKASGIKAAAAVPILAHNEAIAVLLFLVREARPEDLPLIELVRAAVAPLGTLIQRKRAEDALRDSEARLRVALQAAGASVWHWDLSGDEAWWSPEMFELWGVKPTERMRLANSLALIHPDDRERVRAAVEDAIARRVDYRCEFRIRHSRLGERWMASHGRLVLDAAGRPIRMLGISMDITERKRTEDELVRHREHLEHLVSERTAELQASNEKLRMADRLASIGTLAAGLGHDMNNVLLPVRAHINALRASGEAGNLRRKDRAHVDEVRKSVTYLQQLADGLHFLAMNPDTEEDARGGGGTTDLRQWWSQAGALLSKGAPKHARVTASFRPDLPPVRVPAHALTQAVLNLVVNAGEAIPPPSVRRRRQGYVRLWAERVEDASGTWVRLGVTDNGTGMTEEVKRRAFEMFFTTKPRGLGTGLGLALVRKVAEHSGGRVEVETELGKGTTIVMVLPAAAPAAMEANENEKPGAVITISNGRAAALLGHLLRSSGMSVRSDSDASKARVWVVDPAVVGLNAVKEWRAGTPDARVVLFGAPDPEERESWFALDPVTIDNPDDFESLRSAMTRALAPR